jgi:hypothetical protein
VAARRLSQRFQLLDYAGSQGKLAGEQMHADA